ncbi:hypothetical protein Bbelb_261120 [Branchiostoma belcheri]|nr:hypothetical protein Bbelb_261120 [Branchiostoma belcheri]
MAAKESPETFYGPLQKRRKTKFLRTMQPILSSLYLENSLTDVEIRVGTETVEAHAVVLASVSNVFYNKLSSKTKSGARKVASLDVTERVTKQELDAFLSYVYGSESANSNANIEKICKKLNAKFDPEEVPSSKMLQEVLYPNFYIFQTFQRFCDVAVCVEGKTFFSHRAVLACCCPYFYSFFTCGLQDSQDDMITLQGISSDSFAKILHFIYTTELELCLETVQDVMVTANFLQVPEVLDMCAEFLYCEANLENCADILGLCEDFNLTELRKKILEYVRDCKVKDAESLGLSSQDLALLKTLPERKLVAAAYDFYLYTEESKTWAMITSLPEGPRSQEAFESASLGSCVYVVGGKQYQPYTVGPALSKAQVYDLKTNTWRDIAFLHQERKYHYMVGLNGWVYAMGGMDSKSQCLHSVERYNPTGDYWEFVDYLPLDFTMYSVTTCMGYVFVMGATTENQHKLLYYDSECDMWIDFGLKIPESFEIPVSIVGYRERMYFFVGYGADMMMLNIRTGQWTHISSCTPCVCIAGGTRYGVHSNILFHIDRCMTLGYDVEEKRWNRFGKFPKVGSFQLHSVLKG